jgi:hypothetical protein
MLLAKINPAATFTSQDGPFAQPTIVTADHLTALARPYVAGADKTNFEVIFGTYVPAVASVEASEGVEAVQAKAARFIGVESSQAVLTAEELVSWGLDDSVLLEVVASKLGTAVVETVVVEGNQF